MTPYHEVRASARLHALPPPQLQCVSDNCRLHAGQVVIRDSLNSLLSDNLACQQRPCTAVEQWSFCKVGTTGRWDERRELPDAHGKGRATCVVPRKGFGGIAPSRIIFIM